MAKPNRKEQDRRQRILEAAIRIFKKDGLSRASMRSIALEAGCTTGAIYPLFAGKEDIYACLLEESLDRLYSAVAEAAAPESDAHAALSKSVFAFFDYYAATRFEVDLGLNLFGETDRKGLGKVKDTELNARLLKSLNIFMACLIRMAPEDNSTPLHTTSY